MYKRFSKDYQVLATDICEKREFWCSYQDVRNYHQLHYEIGEFNPHVIINLAAMVDMEQCEINGQSTLETNTGGSANLATIASRRDATYIYISTAGIFGGGKEAYTDSDEPTPLSIYAKAKYYGELIATTVPKHIVIRPGWMMGGGPKKDKKFINKIYQQIQEGATEINAVSDKGGTPTYTHDLARNIQVLLEGEYTGVYNCTCKGATNRYEVAKEFVRLIGREDVKVNPVESKFFKDYWAPRPTSEKLICQRLEDEGIYTMRTWQECLAEYAEEYK